MRIVKKVLSLPKRSVKNIAHATACSRFFPSSLSHPKSITFYGSSVIMHLLNFTCDITRTRVRVTFFH